MMSLCERPAHRGAEAAESCTRTLLLRSFVFNGAQGTAAASWAASGPAASVDVCALNLGECTSPVCQHLLLLLLLHNGRGSLRADRISCSGHLSCQRPSLLRHRHGYRSTGGTEPRQ